MTIEIRVNDWFQWLHCLYVTIWLYVSIVHCCHFNSLSSLGTILVDYLKEPVWNSTSIAHSLKSQVKLLLLLLLLLFQLPTENYKWKPSTQDLSIQIINWGTVARSVHFMLYLNPPPPPPPISPFFLFKQF